MAWVYEKHQYKNAIISALSTNQLQTFKYIFNQNQTVAVYILRQKLFTVLDLDTNLITSIVSTNHHNILHKVHQVIIHYNSNCGGDSDNNSDNNFDSDSDNDFDSDSVISCADLVTKLFLKSNIVLNKITAYNASLLYKFCCDEEKFVKHNVPIKWGPGNHPDRQSNIEAHYLKHVCTYPESEFWAQTLSINSWQTYEKYATESFYKMSNIIVHSNGRNVYLSGFYGNVFIIGRYNGNEFGISSCYYVESGEKQGRLADACFVLSMMGECD